jgi:hypothetical protein
LSAPDTSQRDIELRDRAIERIARIVVDRRLETPAVIFLEANRPLRFLVGQGLLMTLPVVGSFIAPADLESLARALDSEDSLDQLIARIEHLAANRRAADKHA